MAKQTLNWNEKATDRMRERTMQPEGKRADNFKTYWYDRLTEAAKEEDPQIYQAELNDYYQAVNARKKWPEFKIDDTEVKPL